MGGIDEREFIGIVEDLYGSIYRMALSVLGDEGEACDVTQESFERLWRERRRVEAKAAAAWLRRTALNLCFDVLRRRSRESVSEEGEPEPIDPRPDPLEGSLREERVRLLREALGRLPIRYRVAVVLKDIEGLSYEEMSELLGRPVNTLKSDVFRGRRMLRKLLEPYLG